MSKDTIKDPKDISQLGRIGQTDLANYNPMQEKIEHLEMRIKILGDICTEINPYDVISDDLKMRLMDFNILDLSDPFKVTNQLLLLLEDTIDELHVLKPFDDSDLPVKEIL